MKRYFGFWLFVVVFGRETRYRLQEIWNKIQKKKHTHRHRYTGSLSYPLRYSQAPIHTRTHITTTISVMHKYIGSINSHCESEQQQQQQQHKKRKNNKMQYKRINNADDDDDFWFSNSNNNKNWTNETKRNDQELCVWHGMLSAGLIRGRTPKTETSNTNFWNKNETISLYFIRAHVFLPAELTVDSCSRIDPLFELLFVWYAV